MYVIALKDGACPEKSSSLSCVYVGLTGLTVEKRFRNHQTGHKSSKWVKNFGLDLMPELFDSLNPMTYEQAVKMERELADDLRSRGYIVFGGH